uniref:CRAL-TRIO domain-containing protein n=1 Tax=viral metagenome TaxID=1070528 RepID=A0A6C0BBQ7_9ZZZZ
MKYECSICKLVPSSHSLTKILERKGILYYYTCPAQATLYYDVKGIVNHYDGVLSETPENKEWVWIFDSLGFNITHAMETTVAIELANLISNKFSKNLKKIIIINPTFYISITHKIIMPFLNSKVRDIIEINYESRSAEEVLL